MDPVIFKNGCAVIPIIREGDETIRLETANISKIQFTSDEILTIEMSVKKVVFHKGHTEFPEEIWKTMTDKVVWGFVEESDRVVKNDGNSFTYFQLDESVNKPEENNKFVGNQINITFDDAKIGGAG